jgi:hypothetical protein
VHADGHAGLDLRGLDIDGQGDEFRHMVGMGLRLAEGA